MNFTSSQSTCSFVSLQILHSTLYSPCTLGLSSRAITQGLPFKKWIHPTPCITDRLSRRVFFKPICTCMCTRSNSQLTSDTSTDVTSRSAKPFDLTAPVAPGQSELRKLLRKCNKMAGEQLSACCSNGSL